MGMADGDGLFGKLTTLSKSTAVTVLDELYFESGDTVLDADSYYFVLVESESGAASYGFIPSDYVLPYPTDGAAESTYTMRSLKRGGEHHPLPRDGQRLAHTGKRGAGARLRPRRTRTA